MSPFHPNLFAQEVTNLPPTESKISIPISASTSTLPHQPSSTLTISSVSLNPTISHHLSTEVSANSPPSPPATTPSTPPAPSQTPPAPAGTKSPPTSQPAKPAPQSPQLPHLPSPIEPSPNIPTPILQTAQPRTPSQDAKPSQQEQRTRTEKRSCPALIPPVPALNGAMGSAARIIYSIIEDKSTAKIQASYRRGGRNGFRELNYAQVGTWNLCRTSSCNAENMEECKGVSFV